MIKPLRPGVWLEEVEAVEERLEALKLTSPRAMTPSMKGRATPSVVRATAGLLGKRFPRGAVYTRRLRRLWARSSDRRRS